MLENLSIIIAFTIHTRVIVRNFAMAVVANRLFINISVGRQSTEIICMISVGIQNADMIVCLLHVPLLISGKF